MYIAFSSIFIFNYFLEKRKMTRLHIFIFEFCLAIIACAAYIKVLPASWALL
jgi:hypothetical protein